MANWQMFPPHVTSLIMTEDIRFKQVEGGALVLEWVDLWQAWGLNQDEEAHWQVVLSYQSLDQYNRSNVPYFIRSWWGWNASHPDDVSDEETIAVLHDVQRNMVAIFEGNELPALFRAALQFIKQEGPDFKHLRKPVHVGVN